jgi:poly(3-hydroxyalkanoate) synthetase
MADPFDIWRVAWTTALREGAERVAEAWLRTPASVAPAPAAVVDLSTLPTLGQVRLELSTMLLLEERGSQTGRTPPTLIVAPYAVHEASIADFAPGHSLAEALSESGAGPVALTYWKSATPEMRRYDIDAYMSSLTVAVDDLGGRVSLVGLCQGGWLAAAFAARFPDKVAKLVLAGAPIDVGAAPSNITRALAMVSPVAITGVLAANGGRVLGGLGNLFWSDRLSPEFNAEAALQGSDDAAIVQLFRDWDRRIVDLPGAYFVQAAEWIFRENRLAGGSFRTLGRDVSLAAISAPIFVLAARDDEIVPPPQATAVEALCGQTRVTVRVEPGRHLSLFMGRRTVATAWRDIARWLAEAESVGTGPAVTPGIARPRKLKQDAAKEPRRLARPRAP